MKEINSVVYSEKEPSKECLWLHYVNGKLTLEAFGNTGWVSVQESELSKIGNLEDLATEAKNSLVEAINEVAEGSAPVDLPIATPTQLGGVKIGDGISVTEDGTISSQGGGNALPVIFGMFTDSMEGVDGGLGEATYPTGATIFPNTMILSTNGSYLGGLFKIEIPPQDKTIIDAKIQEIAQAFELDFDYEILAYYGEYDIEDGQIIHVSLFAVSTPPPEWGFPNSYFGFYIYI